MLRATPESPRMFESDFFDVFSRTHFAMVPIIYVPAAAAMAWYSVVHVGLSGWVVAALMVGGFGAWTFSEYWLHRTLFHWIPKGRFGERMHFLIHGVHHNWPNDKYRLVMPPAASLLLFVVFLGLFVVLLGTRYCWAFHAGYTIGYMAYDMMHYYVHHGRPKSRYLKELRRHHMVHHFKSPDLRYGVSSKFWDFVFRTES